MAKRRLDALLTERGLFPSRSRAAASVLAGEVRLGRDRRRAAKPGQMVTADIVVDVAAAADAAQRAGAVVLGFAPSGLAGPKGNRETFVWLGEPGRAGIADVEAAAREVEP